jgi:glutathione S-transferase
MFLIRHHIKFNFKITNFVDDPKAAAELAQETPINRIPILVDGGFKIFDSRVIVSYITKKHSLPELTHKKKKSSFFNLQCDERLDRFVFNKKKRIRHQRSGIFPFPPAPENPNQSRLRNPVGRSPRSKKLRRLELRFDGALQLSAMGRKTRRPS